MCTGQPKSLGERVEEFIKDLNLKIRPLYKTEDGFSIPYWVLIVLASTALVAMIIITKKR